MSRWVQKPTSRYARMECPVTGCTYERGQPLEGTVPGIKHHVRRVHGPKLYAQVRWPPLYRVGTSIYGDRLRDDLKPLETMTIHELRAVAQRRGIVIHGKNKPELLADLS